MWFLEDFSRLNRERREIGQLLAEVDWLLDGDWLIDGNKLCLLASISAHGHQYPIKLVYPHNFPATPPSVFPQDPSRRWSGHQYGTGGELCLEWGPDNWQEHITGAEILRSVYRLLRIENPLGDVEARSAAPSRHSLTLGQELRTSRLRFICDEALRDRISSDSTNRPATAQIILITHLPVSTAFVKGLKDSNGEEWQNPVIPADLGKGALEVTGHIVSSSLDSGRISELTIETCLEFLHSQGILDKGFENQPSGFFLLSSSNGELHLLWISDQKTLLKFSRVDVQGKHTNGRLSPDFANLSGISVGIVGLGSAGSKIALSLARTGVRRFTLVDHDIFLPENICRHDLNWEYVGQHKVDAMKYNLGLISNEIEVSLHRLMLSGQEASASIDGLQTKLGDCDLIIDASADPSVFNQLSAIAARYRKPFVWMEVFAGGIGGLSARYRPGTDPDPKVMRAYLLGFLEKQDDVFPEATADYTGVTDDGSAIVATDSDVGIIAAYATQMALDLLLESEPSRFPLSMYLIGMTQGWIFKEPYYTIPIDLSEVQSDTIENEATSDDLTEAYGFLKGLIEKLDNENPPSA